MIKSILLSLLLGAFLCSQAQNNFFVKNDTLSLYYGIDKHQLNEAQKEEVKQILLSKDSVVSINIKSFADYLATEEYNQELSNRRAEQIKIAINKFKSYLFEIETESYGQQLEKNDKEKLGNSNNRRVDLIVGSWIFPSSYTSKEELVASKEKIKNKVKKSPVKKKEKVEPIREVAPKSLEEAEVGDRMVMKNLNFIGGRHILLKKSKPHLKTLVDDLKLNPKMKIEIHGHICCQGSGDGFDHDTGKMNLSEARAFYIYRQLIKNGIDKSRLSYKGFGASEKIYIHETTEAERIKNRRVEILVMDK